MPVLHVRNCPKELYQKIVLIAKTHHRPLAQQIVALLEKGVGQETSNIERRRRLLTAINHREIAPQARQLDPVALIRVERDR